jgi:hypothetical protein
MPWPGWSEEQVIDALATYHARYGRWPTRRDWQAQREVPSYGFIVRHWGWRGALRLAGGVARPAGVVYCRNGHDRIVNTVVGPDGTRRCRVCLAGAVLRRALRDRRAADVLPAYAAKLMPSTVAHLQRLGPDELAEVQRVVDDELVEAARHMTRLVALRDQAKRLLAERTEQPAAPTPQRRMAIAAAASTPRHPPTARRPRARGG